MRMRPPGGKRCVPRRIDRRPVAVIGLGLAFTLGSTLAGWAAGAPPETKVAAARASAPRGDARSDAVQADALPDHKLDAVHGGTNTTPGQVKTKSDFYRDTESEVEGTSGGGGNQRTHGNLGGQVK